MNTRTRITGRPYEVAATHSFEIEIALTGKFEPGYAASRDDPGCDDSVEDVDIADIGALVLVQAAERERASHRRVWSTKSLLDGVDRKSEAYQQIVRNILAFIGDDADRALVEAASE